ncbi:Imm19 family immunity protein [Flavobacterium aquidurense]|uniref:Imm19 family immunity protein n=1 Tax=Flavobacterium aquidurense TaxID=362413 RepID=UPI0037577BB6
MNNEITIAEIRENTFFWKFYLCWFRGFDDKEEINIDEAVEVIETNETDFYNWERLFFNYESIEENPRYISGNLADDLNFAVEFQEYEINFFLNDIYIGNLGGHFEAWFLTLDELLAFEKDPVFFLLLLPMTGIQENQKSVLKPVITKHLESIPEFKSHSAYIANCILNGLIMVATFQETAGIGIINNENHSVRNIIKYPRYEEDVKQLNRILLSLKK